MSIQTKIPSQEELMRQGNESMLNMMEGLKRSNPILAKIFDHFQQNGVSLMDDGKGGTIPDKPTPIASHETAAAMETAKQQQEAIKAQQNQGQGIS